MSSPDAFSFRSLRLSVAGLLVFCLAGCASAKRDKSRYTGMATIGARTVKVSMEGMSGALENSIVADGSQDATTIKSPAGTIVVQKTRVLLNGSEFAQLPEHARLIEVDYTDGKLTIAADGTRLPDGPLRR